MGSVCNKDNFNHVWIFSWKATTRMRTLRTLRTTNLSISFNFPKHFYLALLVLLSVTILSLQETHAAEATDMVRLRTDLLRGYDKFARPVQNHQNATMVKFNLYLKGFDFDERRSTFTLYGWSVMNWRDEHIKWDPKAYANLTRIHFNSHELWVPDLNVFNNLDKSEIDHFGNTRILAYSTSVLVWVPPTKFQVGCTSDLRNWPVDTQTCVIILGSWAHDGSQVNLRLPTNQTWVDTSDLIKNREWDLIGTWFQKRVHFFDCCPGVPFPDLLMTFTIARESSTHKAAVVVPGLAIAMGVLIAFWIQPGATERLMLLLVCIINNTMYLNYIYRMLPNNGDSVPLVLLFYRDSLMMIAVALIWTIALRYLAASKRTSPVPLPGFIQSFLASIPAKILCLDPRPTSPQGNDGNTRANANGETGVESGASGEGKLIGGNPYQEDWAWLAHLLDRVAFLLYFILYLCFYVALL